MARPNRYKYKALVPIASLHLFHLLQELMLNGEVYLEAANPKYPIIRPRRDLQLGGVVTGVIRKYH